MLKGILVTCSMSFCALAQGTEGLRLFAPVQLNEVQLVDGQGTIVHSWPGNNNIAVHLDDEGTLLRSVVEPNIGFPGTTGRLQKVDIDGNITWDWLVSDGTRLMHHDLEPLPNGNVLIMVADLIPAADAIANGRDPALLPSATFMPESILEVQQTGPTTGQIVWEWHVKDHLIQDFDPTKAGFGVVADHPELLDINYPPIVLPIGNFNHANGVDYDPINDWIIISAREQDEVWLIDHSTTSAEAAGHTGGARGKGGDFLWRWGNPEAYDRGTPADRTLFQQHDPRFIPPGYPGAGHITIFNNQFLATQSQVLEIELPLDGQGMPFIDPGLNYYGPASLIWSYTDPSFFSGFVSSAERLANGNTLICAGAVRRLFEVDAAGTVVWDYTHPGQDIIFQTHNVDRRLWQTGDEFSVANGGRVDFTHISDSRHDGDLYYVLASLAGTAPGVTLPGGMHLPLNEDVLLIGMLLYPNIGVFQDTLGMVDSVGNAASAIDIPAGLLLPALIGKQMNVVHALVDGTGFVVEVSNVVTIDITP